MKQYMKKFFCFILMISMISSMNIVSHAADSSVDLPEQDTDVSIVQDKSNVVSDKIEDEAIRYDYEIGEVNDDGISNASLTFTLPNSENQMITVQGYLESVKDSSGNSFLMGPLEGETVIDNVQYDVTAGFTKALETGHVNVGVTISNGGNASEEIVFAFGEKIERVIDENLDEPTEGSVKPLSFTNVANVAGNIKNTSVTGVTAYGDYEKSNKRFKVRLRSHKNAVKNYYMSVRNDVKDVRLSKYKVGLRCKSTDGKSHISTIYKIPQSGSSGTLKSLFEDILSFLNIPTSTISAMLGSAKGSVTSHISGSECYLDVSVGVTSDVNFDSKYFPVIFNLSRDASGTASITQKYQFFATTQYNLTGYIPQKGTVSFYSNTEEAAKTVSVSM